MREYRIKIIERLSTVVPVQEENADSALEKVQAMYRDSKIVLTADDYVDTEIKIISGDENTEPEGGAKPLPGSRCSCGSNEFEVNEVTSAIVRVSLVDGNLEYPRGSEQIQSIEHVGPYKCKDCGALYLTLDESKDLPAAVETTSTENGKPPLREVYVKVGTEVIGKVPASFIEYSDFWSQHNDDTGFTLIYLDTENRIVD